MAKNLQLITADSRKLPIQNSSVRLAIVHPPYFKVDPFRYGGNPKKQLNFGHSKSKYVKNIVASVKELERVLTADGSIWINVGPSEGADVLSIAEIVKKTNLQIADNLIHHHPDRSTIEDGLKSDSVSVWYRLVKSPQSFHNVNEINKYSNAVWTFRFNNLASEVDQELAKKYHVLDVVNEELPKRLIQMYSTVGDTVLDSFGGSAIVAVTAAKLGRIGISVDVSSAQKVVAEERARLTL